MAWTFNNIRIFPQDIPENIKNIMARLQPLNGGTVLQHFGYESNIVNLRAVVVGKSNADSLLELAKTNSSYALVGPSPWNSAVYFYVSNVTIKPRIGCYQTLIPSLGCDAPVYDVDMELYIDE
jgi:hypothetical protein